MNSTIRSSHVGVEVCKVVVQAVPRKETVVLEAVRGTLVIASKRLILIRDSRCKASSSNYRRIRNSC